MLSGEIALKNNHYYYYYATELLLSQLLLLFLWLSLVYLFIKITNKNFDIKLMAWWQIIRGTVRLLPSKH